MCIIRGSLPWKRGRAENQRPQPGLRARPVLQRVAARPLAVQWPVGFECDLLLLLLLLLLQSPVSITVCFVKGENSLSQPHPLR